MKSKRFLCLLLVLLMVFSLTPSETRAETTVYFTAVNDQLLPDLSDETMPFWSGGRLYIPSTVVTGTDLGLFYSRSRDKSTAVVYRQGSALTFNFAALGSAVNSVGEGVQENVIADSIRIRILAVGEGERGSSSGALGGIDIELDGSLGAQVALSVISGRSNIGDLGEEGVDHDDNVIIFLRPNTRRLSRFPVIAAKICKSSNCCRNNRK